MCTACTYCMYNTLHTILKATVCCTLCLLQCHYLHGNKGKGRGPLSITLYQLKRPRSRAVSVATPSSEVLVHVTWQASPLTPVCRGPEWYTLPMVPYGTALHGGDGCPAGVFSNRIFVKLLASWSFDLPRCPICNFPLLPSLGRDANELLLNENGFSFLSSSLRSSLQFTSVESTAMTTDEWLCRHRRSILQKKNPTTVRWISEVRHWDKPTCPFI